MDQSGAKLLPFYLVIDVSWSMSLAGKLDAANAIMPAIVDALAQQPILVDKVRFGLIDFSDDARVRLPLCDLLDPDLTLPALSVRGGTSFAAAFTLLRREIEANVAQLKADQYVVHRPVVWFISDGEPTDDDPVWRAAFQELTSSKAYPNVIPCGVDQADVNVMGSLIHPSSGAKKMALYMMDPTFQPAKAITSMAEVLISSMIQSGHSLASGSTGVVLPPKTNLPAGITQYDPDDFV
ncbi:VWA domain-containing protein [Micromonospora sp. WMMD882]|uniref:vWA domain-containing protein n=1 Tax=Micromonospora sp. WMMD882 TaxID=3015151 RepID=UPI00248AB187|nr:VWA domain-containing protein [Micromonospora sp. WMMD882]WBB80601.1 VWA domain-containing protein [Micromonospora sp. WMMD882]